MATKLAAELRVLMTRQTFVEARLQMSYELGEDAHQAMLYLYCTVQHESNNTIYNGDEADNELELWSSLRSVGDNKRFIKAFQEFLPLDWCYMSVLTEGGFNRRPVAHDVSASFDFQAVLDAFASLNAPVTVAA